jgi:hypothetical protein
MRRSRALRSKTTMQSAKRDEEESSITLEDDEDYVATARRKLSANTSHA